VLKVRATGIQDTGGRTGIGARSTAWVIDTTAPQVLVLEPIRTNPRNIVIQSLEVTLSEPIDLATFDRTDIRLTRNGEAANLVDERVVVEHVSGAIYRIRGFNWVTGIEGTYTLVVTGSGIQDPAGNTGTGSAEVSWIMDSTAPLPASNLAIDPDLGVTENGRLTNTRQIVFSGQLSEPGLTVRVFDRTTGTDLGYAQVEGTTFRKPITFNSTGQHRLQVRVIDQAGNVDTASRTDSELSFFNVFVDDLAFAVQSISPVASPRPSLVSSVDFVLTKELELTTLDYQDITLTRNGGSNLITSDISFSRIGEATYQIAGLEGLTDLPGNYVLTIHADGLQDRLGNAGVGSKSISWSLLPTDSSAAIVGQVFHDLNGNARLDLTEPGLAGWTLFLDQNDNNQLDEGEVAVVTDAAGRYAFELLSPGTYTVVALARSGWQQSLPGGSVASYQVTLAYADTAQRNFGQYLPVSIEGFNFLDANGNGVWEDSERGLEEWQVYLDLNQNGKLDDGEPVAATDADGRYRFDNLRPGRYVVAEVVKPGWEQTYPNSPLSGLHIEAYHEMASWGGAAGSTLHAYRQNRASSRHHDLFSNFSWKDQDPSTPYTIDVYYDFRNLGAYANQITSAQIAVAELAMRAWEAASEGVVQFVHNVQAPQELIINIGTGDLAALGYTSAPKGILALGGGTFSRDGSRSLSSGIAWMDFAEVWELTSRSWRTRSGMRWAWATQTISADAMSWTAFTTAKKSTLRTTTFSSCEAFMATRTGTSIRTGGCPHCCREHIRLP
jgi:hypothetical protein